MYSLLQAMRKTLCQISDSRAKRWGERLGRLLWCVVPQKRKRIATENIILAGLTDSKKEAAQIARRSVERFGSMFIEVMRFPLYREGLVTERVRFHNMSFLDELAAQGKGCVLSASHMNNWELLGGALGSRYPKRLVAVGFKQSNEGADRFIRETRSMLGQIVIYPENMRQIMRLLDKGCFIALLFDQDLREGGVLADFFDTRVITATGPAVLSYSRGVPIVHCHIRGSYGNYDVEVFDPIYCKRDDGKQKKKAILATTIELNHLLSELIRQAPEDWFWLHNRWKWTRRLYGDPRNIDIDEKQKYTSVEWKIRYGK